MEVSHRPCHLIALGAFVVSLAAMRCARAEDLTTLSGKTYHDVKMVRVEPDGVIWEHASGVCKVDFTDLPEAVRAAYHYDAKQAAAFQAKQTQTRQQAEQQAEQDQQQMAVWRAQRAKTQNGLPGADAQPGNFSYRRQSAEMAATRSVGEQMEAKKIAEQSLSKDDGTVWDRRLWALPCLLRGGYDEGLAFDPKSDLNPLEYKASLHSQGPDFFNPDNMTKDYYKEVDRSEAFARGQP